MSNVVRSVPALSLIELRDFLMSQGLVRAEELAKLRLSYSHEFSDPQDYKYLANERVPEFELVTLWNYTTESLKCDVAGFEISNRMVSQYRGPLAKMILHSETIEQAFEILVSRHKWANPSDNWTLKRDDIIASTIRLEYQLDKESGYPLAFIERNMSMVISWVRKMTGENVFPVKTGFVFKQPKDIERYSSQFGESINFEASVNYLCFDESLVKSTNVCSDPYIFELLRSNHDALMNNYFSAFQIVSRVKQEIISSLPVVFTIDQMSNRLNMSRSSLYRRLNENGTSYSNLLRETRMQLAEAGLKRDEPITVVAYDLGFTDTSSFQKSFKSWFSEAPGKLKKRWKNEISTRQDS